MKNTAEIKSTVPLFEDGNHQFASLVSKHWGKEYLILPEYSYLPDYDRLSECERDGDEYFLKNIDPGNYLTGCKLISNEWVNKGFCGWLFREFGLIIDEAYPIIKKQSYLPSACLIEISFKHLKFESVPMDFIKHMV